MVFICLIVVNMFTRRRGAQGVLFHVFSKFSYLLWFTRRPGYKVFIYSIFVDLFTRRPGYRVSISSIVVNMLYPPPGVHGVSFYVYIRF